MRTRVNREIQLVVIGGFVAGLVTLSQFNIQEVLRVDRFQHTVLSALIFVALFFAFGPKNKKILPAILIALSFGFLKEFTDPSFESMDIVANFMGVSLGLLLVFASQMTIPQRRLGRSSRKV